MREVNNVTELYKALCKNIKASNIEESLTEKDDLFNHAFKEGLCFKES